MSFQRVHQTMIGLFVQARNKWGAKEKESAHFADIQLIVVESMQAKKMIIFLLFYIFANTRACIHPSQANFATKIATVIWSC